MVTTELFQKVVATEAAFTQSVKDSQIGAGDLQLMKIADEAFAEYVAAVSIARAKWDGVPSGDAKDSAEQNANDTEDTDVDQLRWYEIALMTWEVSH